MQYVLILAKFGRYLQILVNINEFQTKVKLKCGKF